MNDTAAAGVLVRILMLQLVSVFAVHAGKVVYSGVFTALSVKTAACCIH